MKIHEYQSKTLLAQYGISVPCGEKAETAVQAGEIFERIRADVVLKAQVHAGGRGKGGGIRMARSFREAEETAREMLGMMLVTPQTGPRGMKVRKLLVEKVLDVQSELYLGIVIDRKEEAVVVIASTQGGMEIEAVASEHPDLIFKEHVHPGVGLLGFQARSLAYQLGLEGEINKGAVECILNLARMFESTDASLVEVNPLAITKTGQIVALDAKIVFDDNALARHPLIKAMRDLDEESPLEVEAAKYNLNYIKLDGHVGCMVNGAGLAMATMDVIKLSGGMPANFLDVGGGVSEEAVANAFKILISDPDVRCALINIFGGIVRCDLIAKGVVTAVRELETKIPIVVLLEGTNADLGKKILQASGLAFETAENLKDAAEKAVALAKPELRRQR